ncbi:MAG: hypothetical protein LQ338_002762 [Usnochroma carphineum]|nr:MAG: hypothetical protein LQ338_002762 [Usnochroma carphineum]
MASKQRCSSPTNDTALASQPLATNTNGTALEKQSADTKRLPSPSEGSSHSSPFASSKGSAGDDDITAATDNLPAREGSSNQSLSTKKSILRQLRDRPGHFPRPPCPKSPTEFKKLMATNFWSWATIIGALYNHAFDSSNIPVMEYKGKIYGLRPSIRTLHHDPGDKIKEVDSGFRQLAQEHSAKSFRSDSFIALGHLIEPDNETPSACRVTNYVWALNVSTDPVSLWLVYDYVGVNDFGDEFITDLSHIYDNDWNDMERPDVHTIPNIPPPTMDSWGLVANGTWYKF